MKKESFNIKFLLISFILGCGLLSCNSDQLGKELTENSNSLEIAFNVSSVLGDAPSTRANNEQDTVLNLTIFIFDNNGDLEFHDYLTLDPPASASGFADMSRWNSERIITVTDGTIVSALNKQRDIHVLANTEDLRYKISTLSDLEQEVTEAITEKITYGDGKYFLMHGSISNHNFSTDLRAEVGLKRNVSRLDLSVITRNIPGSDPIIFLPPGEKASARIMNVVDRSFIVGGQSRFPSGYTFISYVWEDLGNDDPVSFSATGTFYVNENLVCNINGALNEDDFTVLLLQLPYEKGGQIYTENYYKVQIGEKNDIMALYRNTLYKLKVEIGTLGGETDLSAPLIEGNLEVLPWDETTLTSDMSQTFLKLDATSLYIQREGSFGYVSNVEIEIDREFTANWITAINLNTTTIGQEQITSIAVEGTGFSYEAPRSTDFYIVANNLRKKITVNQEALHSTGSIKLSKDQIYLSPVNPSEDVDLTVTEQTMSWRLFEVEGNRDVAGVVPMSGTGDRRLTFTRGNEYDNGIFKFLNHTTVTYDQIKVANLFLSAPHDTVWLPAKAGNFVQGDIIALGGDASWKVLNKPNWIATVDADTENDMLLGTTVLNSGQADREGMIEIAHVNEEQYTDTVFVRQSTTFIPIGETDYVIVKFWPRLYLDEQTIPSSNFSFNYVAEILNTGVEEIDEKPIGYGYKGNGTWNDVRYPAEYSGNEVISSRNSNQTGGQYVQAIVFFLSEINDPDKPLYSLSNRYIDLDVYGYFYYSPATYPKSYYMDIEFGFYRGGKMGQDANLGYINIGGELVHGELLEKVHVRGSTQLGGYGLDYKTTTKVLTLRYDKEKDTAILITMPNP